MGKKAWIGILGILGLIVFGILVWRSTFIVGLLALVFVAGVYVGYRWGRSSGKVDRD